MKKYFSKDHEWILLEDEDINLARVGITNHAQDSLGDIVYVDLPEVGDSVEAGGEVAVVESAKAASDIYAPLSGEIVEINSELEDNPGIVNKSPMNEGWLFTIKLYKAAELEGLMSEKDYETYISEGE